jgi:hypothetical protein
MAEVFEHTFRDVEFGVLRPAVIPFGVTDLVIAKRFAVGGAGVLLVGSAVGDVAVHDDQSRPVAGFEKGIEGAGQHLLIVGIADAGDIPAVGDEAGGDILAEGQSGVALDGDLVVVVNPAQVGELEMAGQGSGLAADSLHHAAVAAHGVNLEVEQIKLRPVEILGHPAAAQRHAHARGHTLAERAGGGLGTGGPVVFGVAGTLAVKLAKAPDVIELDGQFAEIFIFRVHRLNAAKVQDGVEQHGSVSHGEDETVAIGPQRLFGIEGQEALP